jgi:hypothetical protein
MGLPCKSAFAAAGLLFWFPHKLFSSDNKRLTITGHQPWGNSFAIFPSVLYINSLIPLPANPDSEFPRLDSYSAVAFLPARISQRI